MEVVTTLMATIVIFLCPGCCVPGIPLCGHEPLLVTVHGGRVDAEHLRLQMRGCRSANCRCLARVLESLPAKPLLSDVVQALADGVRSFDPLYKQFLWHLGAACEEYLLTNGAHAVGAAAVSVARHVKLGRLARSLTVVERARRDMGVARAQYWSCWQPIFRAALRVSLARDATRAGGRGVLLSFLCLPNNVGAWAPPPASPLANVVNAEGNTSMAVSCLSRCHVCLFDVAVWTLVMRFPRAAVCKIYVCPV